MQCTAADNSRLAEERVLFWTAPFSENAETTRRHTSEERNLHSYARETLKPHAVSHHLLFSSTFLRAIRNLSHESSHCTLSGISDPIAVRSCAKLYELCACYLNQLRKHKVEGLYITFRTMNSRFKPEQACESFIGRQKQNRSPVRWMLSQNTTISRISQDQDDKSPY